MKLHFTNKWLKHHIENDPDIDCEAGLFSKEWCIEAARREDGKDVHAGNLSSDPNPITHS